MPLFYTRRGGCSTALRRICNPTQINIKICNLQKYNITELIIGELQILIVTNVGLQIRHNRLYNCYSPHIMRQICNSFSA